MDRVCIIATLWLKDPFSKHDFTASLLCFLGVVMVVQSEDDGPAEDAGISGSGSGSAGAGGGRGGVDWGGVLAVFVVLGSALCASLAYCTIRKLKTDPRALEVTATRFCMAHVMYSRSLGRKSRSAAVNTK